MLVALALVVVLLGRAAFAMLAKQRAAVRTTVEEQRELSELREREAYLAAEIAWLETERGAEEEIRTKFRVAKEGEHLIVLVDPPVEEVLEPVPEKSSFFRRMLDFLWPFEDKKSDPAKPETDEASSQIGSEQTETNVE